jgi:hypothetical protein
MFPLNPRTRAKLLARLRERNRIESLGPTRAQLEDRFGAADVKPDGRWRVRIARPDLSAETNKRRMNEYNEMMAAKRAAQTEQSYEADADRSMISVRDRGGRLRRVPVEVETTAAKKGFRAVIGVGRRRRALMRSQHTHMGEPWDWQRASCPGCRGEA